MFAESIDETNTGSMVVRYALSRLVQLDGYSKVKVGFAYLITLSLMILLIENCGLLVILLLPLRLW